MSKPAGEAKVVKPTDVGRQSSVTNQAFCVVLRQVDELGLPDALGRSWQRREAVCVEISCG